MEHEWFAESVDKNELDLEFVLFNSKNSDLYNFIVRKGFKCSNYPLPSKYYVPFYIVYFTFKLAFNRFNFVHCHLFEASLIGIISSKITGVKKRIHTRHHGDFHHAYFPGAVKYDRWINRLSTHIIAVSASIKAILEKLEHVPAEKITAVPHGIPSKLLDQVISEKEIAHIRQKYELTGRWPIIGIVSRFVEWKGIQYIIPAFKKLVKDFPNAKLVLANANGDYEQTLTGLLRDLPPSSFVLVRFEPNINPFFKTFDVFVHTPIDASCEAFGQVYIEALSLEVPMVCTLSGIANDLIKNEMNALVVAYKNSDSIYEALIRILNDKALAEKLTARGKLDVREYTFEKKYARLKSIYQN